MANLSRFINTSRYYDATGVSPNASGAVTAVTSDVLYLLYVDFGAGATVASLDIDVNTAAVGTSARLGYYEVASNGAPGDLIVDLGEISVGSTGGVSLADTATRTGAMFIGIVFEGTPVTNGALLADEPPHCNIGQSSSAPSASYNYYFSLAHSYGALPASAAAASRSTATFIPSVMVKLSAVSANTTPTIGPIGLRGIEDDLYYFCHAGWPISNAAEDFAPGANILFAVPINFLSATIINRIGILIDTADGSGLARIGLYDAGGNRLPRTLLEEGTIDITSSGNKEISFTDRECIGLHYLVFVTNSATMKLREIFGREARLFDTLCLPQDDPSVYTLGYSQAHTYGALPATFSTTPDDIEPFYSSGAHDDIIGSRISCPSLWVRHV